MNNITHITSALFTAGVLAVSSDCKAVTIYDAAADYSLNSNPNGVWSYGYSTTLGGSMTLDTENAVLSSGLYLWRKAGSAGESSTPGFAYNPTASVITLSGPIVWNPGQLSFSPGAVNSEFSVLQFSVPETGQYDVHGVFSSVDKQYGATTDVYILRNGTSLYDGFVDGINSIQSFDETVQLNAGDLLDYVVGVDGNGGGWDTTGLDATVTPVPEPSTFVLAGVGAAALLIFRRR